MRFVLTVFFTNTNVLVVLLQRPFNNFTMTLLGIYTVKQKMWPWYEWEGNVLYCLYCCQKNESNTNYFKIKSILSLIPTMHSMAAWVVDPLKCARRCIHFSGHSAVGWWMERKVEEDVANQAPTTHVPILFLSPEISRCVWAQTLELIPEKAGN